MLSGARRTEALVRVDAPSSSSLFIFENGLLTLKSPAQGGAALGAAIKRCARKQAELDSYNLLVLLAQKKKSNGERFGAEPRCWLSDVPKTPCAILHIHPEVIVHRSWNQGSPATQASLQNTGTPSDPKRFRRDGRCHGDRWRERPLY